jgi:hypothetical protein
MKPLLPLAFLFLAGCPTIPVRCPVLEEIDPRDGSCRRVGESPWSMWHPVSGVAHGGTLHFFGLFETSRYDPAARTWTVSPPLPQQLGSEIHACGIGGRIYVLGDGFLFAFDPKTGVWEQKTPPGPRGSDYGAAVLDGKLYKAAGGTPDGLIPVLQVYDPAKDAWTRKADLKRVRADPVVQAAGGRLWVMGGYTHDKADRIPVTTVECYDPARDAWTDAGEADLGADWYRLASAEVGGKIVVFLPFPTEKKSVVREFDPATGSWRSWESDKPIRRRGGVLVPMGGKLYAWGGFTEEYDVEEGPDGQDKIVFR